MDTNAFEIMTSTKHTFHDILNDDFYKRDKALTKQKTMDLQASLPEGLLEEAEEEEEEPIVQPTKKKPVNFLKANKVVKKKELKKNEVSLTKPKIQ